MPVIIFVHEAVWNTASRVIGFSGASMPITPDATETMGSPVLETAQKTKPGTPVEGSEVTESRYDCMSREVIEWAIFWGTRLENAADQCMLQCAGTRSPQGPEGRLWDQAWEVGVTIDR